MTHLSELFGDIPRMLVHWFQIILHFFYVFQYVSWLTSLPKLYKYRDIFSSRWDIFLNYFADIHDMLVHYFKISLNFLLVYQNVSWPTSLPKLYKYRDVSSSGWDIFLKYFGDIPGIFLHLFKIITNFLVVCQ